MGPETIVKKEDTAPKDESSYIEIEIPYTLFQYLSTENCDVQNICRICLSTTSDVLFPLVSAKENSFLADMFMSLTAVQLTPDDCLPSSICELCQTLIVQYYEFKIKCEKSDCMLRSILKGEFITKEEPPDNSICIKEEKSKLDNRKEVKEEAELVEDVQYLEDFSDDALDVDDKLCIVQDSCKRKRKSTLPVSNDIDHLNEVVTNRKQTQKKPKSHTCAHCSKVFSKSATFYMHLKTKHGISVETRPHPCGQCKESFDSEHDLKVHSALHNKGSCWKCNQCQKEYNTKGTFRRHIQRHMKFKPHACDSCDKTFTELYALRRHVRVHTGERIEKKHVCHICDKRYSGSSLLAAHMSRHIGHRPCECSTCGKRFPSQRLLTSHMLVHTDRKPYACSYCDKRFRHESTRNIHHRTHTGEKPYVCSTCGKSFIQNSNLTLHMRTHTGERPYACSMCERKFTSSSSLKNHERIHTGERPYSCNICGKKFARMNLGAHMRQHTGERPFACSACPKKFVNASRLRDHCRIHTGEKPYECAYCTFTFATKSHLVKHLKSHEPPKKKIRKRELVIVQQVPCNTVVADSIIYNEANGEIVTVTDNEISEHVNDIEKNNITLDIEQQIPIHVAGELSAR